MCKPLTLDTPTTPEFDLTIFRPAVACAVCGGPVFVDEGELLCLDCPLPFVVLEAVR